MSADKKTVEMPLGRHLAILTKMYYGALTRRLAHLEIDRHFSILLFIAGSNKKCTQKCVADALKIDKASMVGIIDNLVKKQYITRIVNPTDRREHWVELTPKAVKILPDIHREIKALNKLALKGLTREEAVSFNNSLSTISANLGLLPADRVIISYKKVKNS